MIPRTAEAPLFRGEHRVTWVRSRRSREYAGASGQKLASRVPAVTAAIAMMLAAAASASTPSTSNQSKHGTELRSAFGPATTKAGSTEVRATPPRSDSSADMTLKGGEEGTVFRTLTVEGEDRIHIEVERPNLVLEMDPERAPGLDWGSARDVLDRTTPDLLTPLLAGSAREASPWVAHPWLSHFAEGAVARFRPDVKGVERWKLIVVNARGEAVATFQGDGDPPREIAWDGRSKSGTPVMPGVSYSYVFEAHDQAGNKRNFVGEGFRVSAFRYDASDGPVLVFSGVELNPTGGGAYGSEETPPIVMETASAVNQTPGTRPVRIEVTAKSFEEASSLAQRLTHWMTPFVIGDPARLQNVALVQTDAPPGAAVKVTTAK